MITTVFTPQAIILATSAKDSFMELTEREDKRYVNTIDVTGLQHIRVMWGKYAIAFKDSGRAQHDSRIYSVLDKLESKWGDKAPDMGTFASYLKKEIIDNDIHIIGIAAGYSPEADNPDGPVRQHVYQILGEGIQRLNLDHERREYYNCITIEKDTIVGRLMRDVKIQNGDEWERCESPHLRCDLFSRDKAIDLARFLIHTHNYMQRVNSASMADANACDIAIVTPHSVEIIND